MKQTKITKTRLLAWCCVFFLVGSWMDTVQAQTSSDIRTKTVTIGFTNEPLRQALFALGSASGFQVAVPSELVDATKTVNLPRAERTVEATLNLLLQGTNLAFQVQGNSIVVSEKSATALGNLYAQNIRITGVVVDYAGEFIPGAGVFVKGDRSKIAVTDANGTFVLQGVNPNAVLTVSFIGFVTTEVAVNGRSEIRIILPEDATTLEDVVITGYQTISRERATGAYSIIGAERLEQKPTFTISQALKGMVPGMSTVISTVDGQERFIIRGQGTFAPSTSVVDRQIDTDPLIVVDGFPIQGFSPLSMGGDGLRNSQDPFNTINPNDVESITILRDAAATSIYGAHAANGVIVITTKKGKKSEKINISLQGFVSVGSKPDLDYAFNMASTESTFWYLEHLREYYAGYRSNTYNPYFYPTQPFRVFINDAASLLLEYHDRVNITEAEFNSRKAQMIANEGKWKKELNKLVYRNSIHQQYNVSLRGGSERMTYSASTVYDKENLYQQGNDNQRIMLNLMNSFQLSNHLSLNLGANASIAKQTNSNLTFTALKGTVSPWTRFVDDDGGYVNHIRGSSSPSSTLYYPMLMADYANRVPVSWFYNPIEDEQHMSNTSERFNARVHASLDYNIVKGWSVKVMGQYERNQYSALMLYRPESYFVRNYINTYSTLNTATGLYGTYFPAGGIFNDRGHIFEGYNLRAQSDFYKKVGKHDISAIAGTEVISSTQNNIPTIWRYGFNENTNAVLGTVDYVNQNTNIFGTRVYMPYTAPGGISTLKDRFFSVYFNAAYTYSGKYTLTASARTDASNFQATKTRDKFSPFWSAGASWIVSSEELLKDIDWMEFLKIRTTYGVAGLAAGKFNASAVTTLGVSAGSLIHTNNEPYTTISAQGNPTLTWEKTRNFDIGIEFRLWNGRLNSNISYYSKYSYDALTSATVPVITQGTTVATFNNAAISNNGVELSLGSRLNITEGFDWSGMLNFAYNKNRVREYNVINTSTRPGTYPNYPLNCLWLYNIVGYTDEGYMILLGKDGTREVVTSRDTSHFSDTINGSAGEKVEDYNWTYPYGSIRNPPIQLSFTSNFTYKRITLSFLITGKFDYYFGSGYSFGINPDVPSYSKMLDKAISVYNEGYDKQKSFSVLPLWNEANKDTFNTASLWVNMNSLALSSTTYFLKGDHLRLHEVYLGYDLPDNTFGNQTFFSNFRIYAQAKNIGVIWSANGKLDPDYTIGSLKPMPTFTFGLKLNFN